MGLRSVSASKDVIGDPYVLGTDGALLKTRRKKNCRSINMWNSVIYWNTAWAESENTVLGLVWLHSLCNYCACNSIRLYANTLQICRLLRQTIWSWAEWYTNRVVREVCIAVVTVVPEQRKHSEITTNNDTNCSRLLGTWNKNFCVTIGG